MPELSLAGELLATENLRNHGPSSQVNRFLRSIGAKPALEASAAELDCAAEALYTELGEETIELAEESLAIVMGGQIVAIIGLALGMNALMKRVAYRSKQNTIQSTTTADKLHEMMQEVKAERSRTGFVEKSMFKRTRDAVERIVKELHGDLQDELASGKLRGEEKKKAKELLARYDSEIKKRGFFSESMAEQAVDELDADLGDEKPEVSEEDLDKEQKQQLKSAAVIVAGVLGTTLAVAGINRLVQNSHMKGMRKNLDGKTNAEKVQDLLDDIRDRDIHHDAGWFGNKLRAAERLAEEEVNTLKQNIRQKLLTPKQLAHAKEVLERYRKVMTKRNRDQAVTDALTTSANSGRINAMSTAATAVRLLL